MAENLEKKLRIVKEAIELELAVEEKYSKSRDGIDGATYSRYTMLHGFAQYLLDEADPINIKEIVFKGRDRVISAQNLLNNAPELVEMLGIEGENLHRGSGGGNGS